MVDFKKSLQGFFKGIKWYYYIIILLFSLLLLISQDMVFFSFLLTPLFVIVIYSLKLNKKLNNSKEVIPLILKSIFLVFAVFIIYFILQYIAILLGMTPFMFIAKNPNAFLDPLNFEISLYSTSILQLSSATIALILAIVLVILLEIIKYFGIMRYFKTNSFKEFFNFRAIFKQLFSIDYLLIFIFLAGFAFLFLIAGSIVLYFLTLLFTESIIFNVVAFSLILLCLFIIALQLTLTHSLPFKK